MSLMQHAKRELKLAGMFNEDADYDGALAPQILKIVKTFSEQEHSGASAGITITILEKLLRFQTLTPITNCKRYWMEVGNNLWQSTRDPSFFSKDSGKTWYNIDKK